MNAADNWGNTPLHSLVSSISDNKAQLIGLLVAAGADVNAVNFRNRTPLFDAVDSEDTDCILALLQQWSKYQRPRRDRRYPLAPGNLESGYEPVETAAGPRRCRQCQKRVTRNAATPSAERKQSRLRPGLAGVRRLRGSCRSACHAPATHHCIIRDPSPKHPGPEVRIINNAGAVAGGPDDEQALPLRI